MTRRRYWVNPETCALEELCSDFTPTARVELMTGSHYDGLRADDGTVIDTARRHREYMKANDLALADDFKKTLVEAPLRRKAEQKRERRDTIGRVTHQLENRSRRR